MKKRILASLIILSACLLFANNVTADVSDNETYTVTIPEAVTVVLTADATNFGTITSSEFGVGNTATHVITVGDGIVASSTSYVTTNDITGTGARQFKIDFTSVASSTYDLSAGGVLTLENAASTASVDINLTEDSKTTLPELGDPAGTPVAFTAVTGAAGYLDIPAVSSVPFDATSKKAPLNMLMDLDENSLSIADAAGDISFQMTLTVVGVN